MGLGMEETVVMKETVVMMMTRESETALPPNPDQLGSGEELESRGQLGEEWYNLRLEFRSRTILEKLRLRELIHG